MAAMALDTSIGLCYSLLTFVGLHAWIYQTFRHPDQVYAAGLDELQATIYRRLEHRADTAGFLWGRVIDCAATDRRQLST
jgi:hypothetical protein